MGNSFCLLFCRLVKAESYCRTAARAPSLQIQEGESSPRLSADEPAGGEVKGKKWVAETGATALILRTHLREP